MKTIPSAIALLAASAAVSWAAVSLDVTKVPVGGTVTGGLNAGPLNDPDSNSGQWFQNAGVRSNEFHDNLTGSGGGNASTSAIKGIVTSITYAAGAGTPIIAFTIDASVTNDTNTAVGPWLNGTNSHGEIQNATVAYVGTMYSTKIVAEFALTDLANQPAQWAYPYTQVLPEIYATNEDDAAWYCYNNNGDPVNPGNYYVPAWDLGDIGLGQSVLKQMAFSVGGSGLSPLDTRYTVLTSALGTGLDVLSNRTTSLKVSNWVDTLGIDNGVAYPHQNPIPGETSELSSNASVFHNIPEPSAGLCVGLAGLLALRRRRA